MHRSPQHLQALKALTAASHLPTPLHKLSQIIGHIRAIRRFRAKLASKNSSRTTFPNFSLPPCAVAALHRAETTRTDRDQDTVFGRVSFCGPVMDLQAAIYRFLHRDRQAPDWTVADISQLVTAMVPKVLAYVGCAPAGLKLWDTRHTAYLCGPSEELMGGTHNATPRMWGVSATWCEESNGAADAAKRSPPYASLCGTFLRVATERGTGTAQRITKRTSLSEKRLSISDSYWGINA